MLELEWVGSEKGSLDSGTLSILSLDKKHTKVQSDLHEIEVTGTLNTVKSHYTKALYTVESDTPQMKSFPTLFEVFML